MTIPLSSTGDSPHDQTLPEGMGRIGKYVLVRKLGKGGMGIVYEAMDTALQRRVALKLLNPQLAVDADYRARFVREARAAARLNHANAIAIYEFGEIDGHWFLALELAKGPSAGDVVRQAPFPWREATRIVADVARALAAAHQVGILHRDVKPSNILLDGATAKLADFGLARIQSVDRSITRLGEMLGTPAYMSPEQCRGEKADALSDIYSLGVTYFVLLTGKLLFEGDTAYDVMLAHCQKPMADPRQHRADIPAACVAILQRALAKEPADRYPSAADMVRDLDHALSEHPPAAPAGDQIAVPGPRPKQVHSLPIETVQMHTPVPLASLPPSPSISRRRLFGAATLVALALIVTMFVAMLPSKPRVPAELVAGVPVDGLDLAASQSVLPVAFSPDCRWLAAGGSQRDVLLWDLHSPRKPQQIELEHVTALAFAPDSKSFAAGGIHLQLFNFATAKVERVSFGDHQPQTSALAFAAKTKTLVVGLSSGADGKFVRLWDLETKSWRDVKAPCHTRDVESIVVSPDGRLAFTGGADGKVGVWDIVQGKLLETLDGDGNVPARLALRADGSRLAVGRGNKIDLYDAPAWKHFRTDILPEPTAWALAYLPGDRDLLVIGGRAWLLDDAGRVAHSFHGPNFDFARVALSPDGALLAIGHLSTRTVRLYKPTDLAAKGR